jgi:hypothetical protein
MSRRIDDDCFLDNIVRWMWNAIIDEKTQHADASARSPSSTDEYVSKVLGNIDAAIGMARDGRPKTLAAMIRLGVGMTPEMRDLIADYMEGKRRRKRGAQPKTPSERMANSPIHLAAELMPAAISVCRACCPELYGKELFDLACAAINRILSSFPSGGHVDSGALRRHMRRPKNDRHRLRQALIVIGSSAKNPA